MAPRGQGFRRGNSRSEKSRLLRLSFLSPLVFPPLYTEEQELDERLTAFKAIVRLQRKRRCIEALERGEDPDESADFERRFISFWRYKSDVQNKLQLFVLRYKDQLQGELNSFLYKLKGRFELHCEDLQTDIQKVVYVFIILEGLIEKRWTSLIQTIYRGQVGMVL